MKTIELTDAEIAFVLAILDQTNVGREGLAALAVKVSLLGKLIALSAPKESPPK